MSGRTLNDLMRGSSARPVDVLRLAMHYLLRGGWGPEARSMRRERPMAIGLADGPITITEATIRARGELKAPWNVGVIAHHALNRAAGFHTESPEPLKAWERDPSRTHEDVIGIFRGAILELCGEEKGQLLDVVA